MKLLLKEHLEILPKIGEQEGNPELIAYVKLFTPWTNWTWYIAEYNPDTGECFGYVEGLEKELGYFDLNELKGIKGPAKLRIERDRLFEPATINSIKKKCHLKKESPKQASSLALSPHDSLATLN